MKETIQGQEKNERGENRREWAEEGVANGCCQNSQLLGFGYVSFVPYLFFYTI